MVTVALLSPPLFGSIFKRTTPLPVPVCPSTTVAQETGLAAVQEQPGLAVTSILMLSGPGPEL
jgi:hypothetical protein